MSSPSYTEVELKFSNLVKTFENLNWIPTLLSMAINIFHVFILSKKSVASTAVNCILLGIGIVDIFSPLIYLKIAVYNFMEGRDCELPNTHLEVIIDWVFAAIRDDFRRCSVWLGLTLAVIRTISLKMATRKRFNFINTSKTGQLSIAVIVFISSIFSICFIFRYQIVEVLEPWIPGKECPELEVLPNHIHYKIMEISNSATFLEKYARKCHLVLTAVFGKIIPSILFPISALILIIELRKAKKLRTANNRQNDKTNRLVVYMTITFIIIELPIGICNLIISTRQGYEDAFSLRKTCRTLRFFIDLTQPLAVSKLTLKILPYNIFWNLEFSNSELYRINYQQDDEISKTFKYSSFGENLNNIKRLEGHYFDIFLKDFQNFLKIWKSIDEVRIQCSWNPQFIKNQAFVGIIEKFWGFFNKDIWESKNLELEKENWNEECEDGKKTNNITKEVVLKENLDFVFVKNLNVL